MPKRAHSGPKPSPAALVDNSTYKKSAAELERRQIIESSIQTQAVLKCPSHLSDEAKKEWKRVMRLYKQMESTILCDLDLQALIMYCEAVAIYKKAQETWTKYQWVVTTNPDSQMIMDKCFKIMEKQTKIVSTLSEQLCLTPVGRARMGMLKANTKDDAADEAFEDCF